MLHTLVLNILRQQGATNYSVLHKKGLVPFLHLHVKLCVVFLGGDSWRLLCKNNGYKNYYCYWSASKNKNRAFSNCRLFWGCRTHKVLTSIPIWFASKSNLFEKINTYLSRVNSKSNNYLSWKWCEFKRSYRTKPWWCLTGNTCFTFL